MSGLSEKPLERRGQLLGLDDISAARDIIRQKLAETEPMDFLDRMKSPNSRGGAYITPEESHRASSGKFDTTASAVDRNRSQMSYYNASTEREQTINDGLKTREDISSGNVSSAKNAFNDMVREDGSGGMGSLDSQRSQDGYTGFSGETPESIIQASNSGTRIAVGKALDDIASFMYHRDPDNALAEIEGLEEHKAAAEKFNSVKDNLAGLGVPESKVSQFLDSLVDLGGTKAMSGMAPSEIFNALARGKTEVKGVTGGDPSAVELLEKTADTAKKMESGVLREISREDPQYFMLKQIMTAQKARGRVDLAQWIESFFSDEQMKRAA